MSTAPSMLMMALYGPHRLDSQKQYPACKLLWTESQNGPTHGVSLSLRLRPIPSFSLFVALLPLPLYFSATHLFPMSPMSDFLDLFLTGTSPGTNTSPTSISIVLKIYSYSEPFLMVDTVQIIQSSAISMKPSSYPNSTTVVSSMHPPPTVIS